MKTSILVVDSDPNDQLDKVLADYEIIKKNSGEEALEYLGANPTVGVIISEFHLGGELNGLEFFGKLESVSSKTVRILISDALSEFDVTYAKERGHIHEFFSKPIELNVLAVVIKMWTK